ncbi:cyclin-dependent kinase inhibitor 1C [Dorcoceras hygrometricum]|uniref:Cyclin-dependent kinase inhibitor 1C n=1 Tax=Dorcoceras hygrometricum TaxID=472368 RepID=A0A2Z7B4R7_9LAMI|nr:cyclin-dependent kinase inhibitor 1C [Dorcoceras hygrometricum]
MNGRTYVLILFFWALLTIVTPMLIRLSASAKLSTRFDANNPHVYNKLNPAGEQRQVLLPRRALGNIRVSPSPAPVVESDFSENLLRHNHTAVGEIHKGPAIPKHQVSMKSIIFSG